MKRVLVTGGAGFIGSHFIKHALATHADWHITNLDKLTYAGNPANLPHSPRHEFVRGDICDRPVVAALWHPAFDIVINFAAETHVDRALLAAGDFILTDILGTFTLLEVARQHGVGCFVQVSTDEVYGEVLSGRVSEETPLRPRNPYAASKAAADQLALAYHSTHGVPVIITRCTNNFGPNQHPEKFIPLCITNALQDLPLPLYGDGRQKRDWIAVTDHCAALDAVVARGIPGRIYNIASNQEVENQSIAEQICALLGKPQSLIRHVTDRPGHDRRYALDATRVRELGWSPQRTFSTALAETVDWYRRNPDWWKAARNHDFAAYYERQYGSRL
jgi:dTDP-glucose 4,6-dehydratase